MPWEGDHDHVFGWHFLVISDAQFFYGILIVLIDQVTCISVESLEILCQSMPHLCAEQCSRCFIAKHGIKKI